MIDRYPFYWKTLSGYLLCVFIQAATLLAASQILLVVLCLISGFCIFCSELVSDLQENLRQLNEHLVKSTTSHFPVDEQNEMRSKLIDIIQFHSEAKELHILFLQFQTNRF